MNITELLSSDLGKQIIDGISGQSNISKNEASSVASVAIPALLGVMQKNASTQEGESGLLSALTSKHDGSILDNITGFFSGDNKSDGLGILGHLLGNKQDALTNGISSKTGVSAGTIASILPMLAPIVMGYLGKQTQSTNASSGGAGLSSLLGGLLGGSSGNFLDNFDQDGDGKFGLNDITGLFK